MSLLLFFLILSSFHFSYYPHLCLLFTHLFQLIPSYFPIYPYLCLIPFRYLLIVLNFAHASFLLILFLLFHILIIPCFIFYLFLHSVIALSAHYHLPAPVPFLRITLAIFLSFILFIIRIPFISLLFPDQFPFLGINLPH